MSKLLVHANEATAAQRRVYFHLVDVTDGMTAETGEAGGQPQVSSDGGAWTNTGIGTLSAIGNGRYYADLTQALVATAGTLIETRYKSANTAECPGDSVQVVAFDPNDTVRLGLTALPNAAADGAGGLPISDAGGLDLDNRMPSATSVTNMNVVFTTDFATNYSTANDQWNVSTSAVASVTGAVGSVTGAVGSVTASVNVALIEAGGIVTTSFANNAITSAKVDLSVHTAIADNAVTPALQAMNLDHLMKSAVDTDWATTVHADSALGYLADTGGSVFDRSTESLEAIRNRGDAAWTTATGFSTLTQAQVTGGAYAMNSASFAFNAALPLTTQQKADVNAEVLDVVNVDTFAEPGQESPAATNTIRKMLHFLFKAWRNKSTETSTEYKLYADDGTTVDQKSTNSDDGTTFTSGEVGSGP